MAITAQEVQVSAIYAAYFGRAPDPQGLSYWVGQLNNGLSISRIAQSFSTQSEATALYPYLSNPTSAGLSSFLTSVYSNLFNRTIDDGGLAYWSDQVNKGRPVGAIIADMISGAQGNDLLTINNKATVGVEYAQAFTAAGVTWTSANLATSHSIIAGVTFDPATVVAAEAQIPHDVMPTPSPTPTPTPTPTAMNLNVAGDTVALNGTTGSITLKGADLATYPFATFGTVAQVNAQGLTSIVSTAGGTLDASGNAAGTTFHFATGIVGGPDAVNAKLTYQGFTNYVASNFNDDVTLTATGQNATGGDGTDLFVVNAGDHTLAGGKGVDTFTLKNGTTTITDLGNNGDHDVVTVAATATLIGTASAAGWVPTSSATRNDGTASVDAKGNNVSLMNAIGDNGWTITNTGGGTNLTGSVKNDTITGGAFADNIGGWAGDDTLAGGGGVDTFTVDGGTDSISDLGNGGNDLLVVSGTANLNAKLADHWSATGITANSSSGTVTVDINGFTVNVAAAGGAGGWVLTNSTTKGTSMTGSDNADTITGNIGSDALTGNDGADILDGGGGADSMTGIGGADTFNVTAGTVLITDLGAGGTDILKVAAGASAKAYAAADWTATAATSNAATGIATIMVGGKAVDLTLATGTGGWKLDNTDGGHVLIIGSKNDDILVAGAAADTLAGGLGNDTLTGTAGLNDLFSVTAGTDTITNLGTADWIQVSSGATVEATMTENWTVVKVGLTSTNDGIAKVDVKGFNANLNEAEGANGWTLTNTGGAATIVGSVRADSITGGDKADSLNGNGATSGTDTLTGGDGADTFSASATGNVSIADLGFGADILTISGTATVTATLSAGWSGTGSSNSSSNTVTLMANGNGVDVSGATGTSGWTLTNAGSDTGIAMTGSGRADSITGGNEADTITGGAAADQLAGGTGADTFVYTTASDSAPAGGIDRITDLVLNGASGDRLDFALAGTVTVATTTIGTVIADADTVTELNDLFNFHSGSAGAQFIGGGGVFTAILATFTDGRLLVADVNGDGLFTIDDTVINVTGVSAGADDVGFTTAVFA